MIHIELSIHPHYHGCKFDLQTLKPLPETPPHVIMRWEFRSWQEAQEWRKTIPFVSAQHPNFEGDLIDLVLDNYANEYAQEEIELLDITGTVYMKAVLAIEGQED